MRKKQNPVNEVCPLTDHKNQCTFNSAWYNSMYSILNKLQNLTEKSILCASVNQKISYPAYSSLMIFKPGRKITHLKCYLGFNKYDH